MEIGATEDPQWEEYLITSRTPDERPFQPFVGLYSKLSFYLGRPGMDFGPWTGTVPSRIQRYYDAWWTPLLQTFLEGIQAGLEYDIPLRYIEADDQSLVITLAQIRAQVRFLTAFWRNRRRDRVTFGSLLYDALMGSWATQTLRRFQGTLGQSPPFRWGPGSAYWYAGYPESTEGPVLYDPKEDIYSMAWPSLEDPVIN